MDRIVKNGITAILVGMLFFSSGSSSFCVLAETLNEDIEISNEVTEREESSDSALEEQATENEEAETNEDSEAYETAEITYREDGIPVIPASAVPRQEEDVLEASEDGLTESDEYFNVSLAPRKSAVDLKMLYTDINGQSHEIMFAAGTYFVQAMYEYSLVNYEEADGVSAIIVDDSDEQQTENLSGDFLKIDITSVIILGEAEIDGVVDTYQFYPDEFIPLDNGDLSYVEITAALTETGQDTYTIKKYNEDANVSLWVPFVCLQETESDTWYINNAFVHTYDEKQVVIAMAVAQKSSYLIGLENGTSVDSDFGYTKYNALILYSLNSNLEEMPAIDAYKLETTLRTRTEEFSTPVQVDGEMVYPAIQSVPIEYNEVGYGKVRVYNEIEKLAYAINENQGNESNDCVTIVVWSGHGDFDGGSNAAYLCPTDYSGDNISGTELRQWLSEIPGRVILIADSCYSGGLLNTAMTYSLDDESTSSQTISEDEAASLFAEAFATEFLASGEEYAINSLYDDGLQPSDDGSFDNNARYQILMAAQSFETSMNMTGMVSGELSNLFSLAFGYDGTFVGNNDNSYDTFSADYNLDGKITMAELFKFAEYSAMSSIPVFFPAYDSYTPILTCKNESSDGLKSQGPSFEVTDYEEIVNLDQDYDSEGKYDYATIIFQAKNNLNEPCVLDVYAGTRSEDSSNYNDARMAMQTAFISTDEIYGCKKIGEVTLDANETGSTTQTVKIRFDDNRDLTAAPLYVYLQVQPESGSEGGTQFMVLKVTVNEPDTVDLTQADQDAMKIEEPSANQYGTSANPYVIHINGSEEDGWTDAPLPLVITYRFALDRYGSYYESRYADCLGTMKIYPLNENGEPDSTKAVTLFENLRMKWKRQDMEEGTDTSDKPAYGIGEVNWDLKADNKLVDTGKYMVEFTAVYNDTDTKSSKIYIEITDEETTADTKTIQRLYVTEQLPALWYRDGEAASVSVSQIKEMLASSAPLRSNGVFTSEDVSVEVFDLTNNDDINAYEEWGNAFKDADTLEVVSSDEETLYLPTVTTITLAQEYSENGYRFSDNIRINFNVSGWDHAERIEVIEEGKTLKIYRLHPLASEEELNTEIQSLLFASDQSYVTLDKIVLFNGSQFYLAEDNGWVLHLYRIDQGIETEILDDDGDDALKIPDDVSEVVIELKKLGQNNCQVIRKTVAVLPAFLRSGLFVSQEPILTMYPVGTTVDFSTAIYSYNGKEISGNEVQIDWNPDNIQTAGIYPVTVSYEGETIENAFEVIVYDTCFLQDTEGLTFGYSASGTADSFIDTDLIYWMIYPTEGESTDETGSDGSVITTRNISYSNAFYEMMGSTPDMYSDIPVYLHSGSFTQIIPYPNGITYDNLQEVKITSTFVIGGKSLTVAAEKEGLKVTGERAGSFTLQYRYVSKDPSPSPVPVTPDTPTPITPSTATPEQPETPTSTEISSVSETKSSGGSSTVTSTYQIVNTSVMP